MSPYLSAGSPKETEPLMLTRPTQSRNPGGWISYPAQDAIKKAQPPQTDIFRTPSSYRPSTVSLKKD